MKNRNLILFLLASIYRAAGIVRGNGLSAKDSFDIANEQVLEGEARGINIDKLGDD